MVFKEACAVSHFPSSNILRKAFTMLFTIAVVLVILWVLGLVTSYTMGGFIHILLVLAVIAILYQIISGRKIA